MTAAATLCRCCMGAHDVEPTYACAHCQRVLCRTQLGLHRSSGFHVVTHGATSRICGRTARLDVQSDMTIKARGWRVPA